MRLLIPLLLAVFTLSVVEGPAHAETAATLLAYSQLRRFVSTEGADWGLQLGADQSIVREGTTLTHAQVERLADFFSRFPGKDQEYRRLRALASQLGCGGDQTGLADLEFAVMGSDDDWHFTPLGRRMLVDVLTAEDGLLFRTSAYNQARVKALYRPGKGRKPQADTRALERAVRQAVTRAARPLSTDGRTLPSGADGRAPLHLEALAEAGMDGYNAVIGVIDTGIDLTHPDLSGRVVVHQDYTGQGVSDVYGHGTHVSSLAAGDGSASGGRFKGAASAAKIAMFKVIHDDDDFGNGPGVQKNLEDRMLAAMRNAAELPPGKRPHILNISFGGQASYPGDPVTEMAAELSLKKNILVIASAGNEGPERRTISSPSDSPYVLSVTGIDDDGGFPDYASRGPVRTEDGQLVQKPDLAAYAGSRQKTGAEGVVGARSKDAAMHAVPGQPRYARLSGTSQSSPFISGAAAAVVGYLFENKTPYRATEVRAVLTEAAADHGWDRLIQGNGVFDARRLVTLVTRRVQDNAPIGNVACMLSLRLTDRMRESLDASGRWKRTGLGIIDTAKSRLINTDAELREMVSKLAPPPRRTLPPELDISPR